MNEAAVLVQGIIDASANIIFGQTVDNTMREEVKITVIATGFLANEGNVESTPIKPVISVMEEVPVIKEQSGELEKQQVKEEIDYLPQEKPINDVELEIAEEPVFESKKGRELPAFMKKLFRK